MAGLLKSLFQFRDVTAFRQRTAQLIGDARKVRTPTTNPFSSLLIVPSDPKWVTGALGDDAMLSATVGSLRKRGLASRVGIVTADGTAPEQLVRDGFVGVDAWKGDDAGARFLAALANYDGVVVVGADMMDGYYSPLVTLQMLRYATLGALAGRPTIILGFSFNEHPSRYAVQGLRELDPRVAVNVRDKVSLDRYSEAVGTRANLVADVAFLLEPDTDSVAVRAAHSWIDHQRAGGRTVVGFNIHPMLAESGDVQAVEALMGNSVSAILHLAETRNASVLLIPHDTRPRIGDEEILARIEEKARERVQGRIALCKGLERAAEIKAVAAGLDLVVTGRMHLAIATLGSGVPIGGLAYQGKFSGLVKHFDLDDTVLLSGSDATKPGALGTFMDSLLDRRTELHAKVNARLSAVLELAARNLLLADGNVQTASVRRQAGST